MLDIDSYKVGQYFNQDVDFAITHKQRRKGLSRLDKSQVTKPLCFEKCRSIHTFGMRFSLLVLFLDIDNEIIGIKKVKPSRLTFGPRRTHSIVEIPID